MLCVVTLAGSLAAHNQLSASASTPSGHSPHEPSPRTSALAGTTIDGVSLSSIPKVPSVAWTLGLTHRTGLVLANNPLGLKLALLQYQLGPSTTASAQLYQRYRTNDGREFNISEWVVAPQYAAKRAAVIYGDRNGQNVRDLTLSLDGQGQIGTHYMDFPANAGGTQPFRVVDVDTNILSVRFSGDGFSYAGFMTIMNNLVDGHTHPGAVAHVQSEVDVSTYVVGPH